MDLKGILHRHFISRPVSNLAAGGVYTVESFDTVQVAVEVLKEENCGSVIINNENYEIKGILTERDIVLKLDLAGRIQTVDQLMTKNPEVIRKNGSIAKALYLLSIGGYRHLPVVHRNRYVEKIISVKDLIKYIYSKLTKDQTPEECEKVGKHELIKRYFCSSIDTFQLIPIKTVRPNTPTEEVVKQLRTISSGAILVCNENKEIEGIFTERDFLTKVACSINAWHKEPIKSYMTQNPIAILGTATVAESYNILSKGGFRHLPVISPEGQAIGLLSIKDFLDRLAKGIVSELEGEKEGS